jgi:hypothetical protein
MGENGKEWVWKIVSSAMALTVQELFSLGNSIATGRGRYRHCYHSYAFGVVYKILSHTAMSNGTQILETFSPCFVSEWSFSVADKLDVIGTLREAGEWLFPSGCWWQEWLLFSVSWFWFLTFLSAICHLSLVSSVLTLTYTARRRGVG